MKRVLVNSVIVAVLTTTSIVACTKGSKDRALKGTAAGADLSKATPTPTPGADVNPATGSDKSPAPTLTTTKITANPGFLKIEGAPAAIQTAAKSLVRISVAKPSSEHLDGEAFVAKYITDAKPTTVEETIKVVTDLKVEDNPTGDVLGAKHKELALLALKACVGQELKSCVIYSDKITVSGFATAGNRIYTTADFLHVYVKTALANNEAYKNLKNNAERIAFLQKTPLNIEISGEGYRNYSGELTAYLEKIEDKAMTAIGSGYKPENLKPSEALVSLIVKSTVTLVPLAKSTESCANITSKKTMSYIVGQSAEGVSRTPIEKNLGDSQANTQMMSQGSLGVTAEVMPDIKSSQMGFVANLAAPELTNLQKTLIISAADSAPGFYGSPILNEKGEYIGIHTLRTAGQLSLGLCLGN